jgi:integrase
MSLLAPTLQAFFCERLITQRDSSPETIASYRDTFRLLLAFASKRTGKQPCQPDIDDLDAPLIGALLNHPERDRGNSPRTRNNRLAAIHSFYKYAAFQHPEHLQTIGRVMAIPTKRYEQNTVTYLKPRRGQGATGHARPLNLARPPRPSAHPARRPDRRAPNAMLLRAGNIDIATIALWLGHDSTKTTRIYEHADPALKEQAAARLTPVGVKPGRYRPEDALLAFLQEL